MDVSNDIGGSPDRLRGLAPSSAFLRRASTVALVLGVAAIAITMRLAFAHLVPPVIDTDSSDYVLIAWKLLHGEGLDLELRRTPGYGIFIAGALLLLGEQIQSVVDAQHALGVINALLAFVLGHRILGAGWGFFVGLATALSGPLILYEQYVMTETLATTLVLTATLLLWRTTDTGSSGWALVTGLVIGAAALCRPVIQIMLPLAIVGLVVVWRSDPHRTLRCVAALSVGAALFMVPWMAKNHVRYGTFTLEGSGQHFIFRLLQSDRGFSFTRPSGQPEPEQETRARVRSILVRQAGPRAKSPRFKLVLRRINEELGLSDAERDRYLRELAFEAIVHQPLYYLQGTLRIFAETFVGSPVDLRREGQAVEWPLPIRHLLVQARLPDQAGSAQRWLSLWDPARLGLGVPVAFGVGVIAAAVTPDRRRLLLIAGLAVTPQLLGAAMAGAPIRFRYPFDPLIAIVSLYGLHAASHLAWRLARRESFSLRSAKRDHSKQTAPV